jgi:hypothetical protein
MRAQDGGVVTTPLVFEIPKQTSTVRCRACNASIVFVETERGRRMPVDTVGETRGQSHFASCSDPRRFRKRDRVKGGKRA